MKPRRKQPATQPGANRADRRVSTDRDAGPPLGPGFFISGLLLVGDNGATLSHHRKGSIPEVEADRQRRLHDGDVVSTGAQRPGVIGPDRASASEAPPGAEETFGVR